MNIFKTFWNKLRSVFSKSDQQNISILFQENEIKDSKKSPHKAELKSQSTHGDKPVNGVVETQAPVITQESKAKTFVTPVQQSVTVLETPAVQTKVKEKPVKMAPVEVKPTIAEEPVRPAVKPAAPKIEAVSPAPALKEVPVELPIDVPVPALPMEEKPSAIKTPVKVEEKPVVEKPAAPLAPPKPAASATNGAGKRFAPYEINDQTAQRLARILVSEIKLYYANKAEDIPKENLYDSLKGPIDKSRQHYRERIGAELDKMPNYFHQELVKSLCEGDESRLGPNYEQ